MNSVLKQLLTGIDGETHDIARWLGVVSVACFLGLTIADFYVRRTFDGQSFGLGLGAVLSATGAFIKLKETTEPKVEN